MHLTKYICHSKIQSSRRMLQFWIPSSYVCV